MSTHIIEALAHLDLTDKKRMEIQGYTYSPRGGWDSDELRRAYKDRWIARDRAAKADAVAATTGQAAAALDAPKLTNQKGEKAIEPIIAAMVKAVEGGAKASTKLTFAGTQAGSRRVVEADFIAALQDRLGALVADASSKWFEYDLQEAEQQVHIGWLKGNQEAEAKAAIEVAYRFDHLADRFREENPEYRWVIPRGQTDGGAWYRFDANPASNDYGIYAPISEETFANSAVAWLRAEEEAARASSDSDRTKEIGDAIQRGTIFKMIAHLRGELSIHADLEGFDFSTNEIVDMAGIRNLDTMEVREPTPDFFTTRKRPFTGSREAYDKHRNTIDKLMSSVHPECLPLYKAFLGTVLRQRQPISKKFPILWGPSKDNGKTSHVEALLGICGSGGNDSFGIKAAHSLLYKHNSNSYAEADLDNRTLTVFDDYPVRHEADPDKLKILVGSGRDHQARQIHKATRAIRLVHTVMITCNEFPNLGRGEDVLDRVEIIEFPYKYASSDQYDPENPWHRERDPEFVRTVREDPEFKEGFYYYILTLHKEWADSNGAIETSTINDYTQSLRAKMQARTNTVYSILSDYAAPSAGHFVSEKDLIGFIRHQLDEQGQGVLSEQTLRKELEMLTLFRQWKVAHHTKKARSRYKDLKDLEQSMWRAPFKLDAVEAPDSANIYSGIRLKTDEAGNLLDEDEWQAILDPKAAMKAAAKKARKVAKRVARKVADANLTDEDMDLFDDADLQPAR